MSTNTVADAPIIAIEGYGFTYADADRPALTDIDLEIRRGEVVAIVGLTGAGKTTLALSLDGVVPHLLPGTWTGHVRVDGQDVASRTVREMAGTVGIVFDAPESQLSQLTVAEEVAFGLENLGVPPDAMSERIAAALRLVELDGLEERSPLGLSGGQQQRLAIAAVLAMRPAVLVLDEATANLDPAGRGRMLELARRLAREDGQAVVVVEHDMDAIAEVVDRVVVLHEGRLVQDGPAASVLGDVAALEAAGLRPPQVVEFAHALGDGRPLPTTVDGALAWLVARP